MSAGDINKIMGAVLVTLLASTAIGHLAEIMVPGDEAGHGAAPTAHATPAVAAAPAARPAAAPAPDAAPQTAAAPATGGEDAVKLIAAADKAAGQRTVQTRCGICHSFDAAAANKIGPALYGVVGRKKGDEKNGYEYSEAMEKKGGNWSYADLDAFLTNPKGFVPGTKMTFAGLANAADRAAVMAFLRGQAATEAPLP